MATNQWRPTTFQVRRGIALVRRVGVSLVLTLSLVMSAAAQTTASGRFEGSRLTLPVGGAYSYWDGASSGNDRVIKVVVSNAEFRPDLVDSWYDRGAAIHDLFADDQVKIVTFEFNADGKYRGYSYYFGSGDGCGYCYDSKVQSTVRPANGRLKGKIAFKSDSSSASFDIDFDVPIPDKVWGDSLPMGGGDPGRVYLAYHKALVASDVDAVKAVSDVRARALYDKHEQEGHIREYFNFRWDDIHHRMESMTITGGFVRGDRAVVLFDGSSKIFGALHGEAILRREGGAWLVDNELIQIGAR